MCCNTFTALICCTFGVMFGEWTGFGDTELIIKGYHHNRHHNRTEVVSSGLKQEKNVVEQWKPLMAVLLF